MFQSIPVASVMLAVIVFTMAYYAKIPFGIGIACLVAFWGLLLQPDRRQLMVFVIGAVLAMAAVELVLPGLNMAYLKDMEVSLAVIPNHGIKDYVYLSAAVLRKVLILACLPLMAVLAVGKANPRHIVFYICLIGGSVILLSQCVQASYLVAALAIPIAAVTLIAGTKDNLNRLAMWVAVAALTYGLITYIVPSLLSIRSNTPDARTTPIAGLPQAYASLRIRTKEGIDLAKMDNTVGNRNIPAEAFPAARSPIPAGLLYGQSLSLNGYAHTLVNLVATVSCTGQRLVVSSRKREPGKNLYVDGVRYWLIRQ